MRRLLVLVVLLGTISPSPALAQNTVDVVDLLEDSLAYAGEVTVVGELIGDYGFRSDGSMWTQLNDDSYAVESILDDGALTGGNVGVAVRIPHAIAETLDPPGGYRVRGPVVQATGIWKYHDPDRGGESYIDVVQLTVVESGRGLVEHPNYLVGVSGLLLVGAALVLRRKPRTRRS